MTHVKDQRGKTMVLCSECDAAAYLDEAPALSWSLAGLVDLCSECADDVAGLRRS